MRKILIIGGTGFIGFHLAKKVLKLGWKVTSISRKKPKKKRILGKVIYKICDITNKKLLQKKIKPNFDYVVNLGGHVDHSNKEKTYLSHYVGLKNLTDIFLTNYPKSFIQIGTGGEYGKTKSPHKENNICKPISIYNKSKLLSSKLLLNLYSTVGFPCTILRLYQAFGTHQDTNRLIPIVIHNCMHNRSFSCSDGSQFRDFIYIDDLVNIIIRCIRSKKAKGEIFNVGTGKPRKIKNLINSINLVIKKGKPLFGKIKLRSDEAKKTYPSIKKAKKFLKWKPIVSFEDGLKKTIKYFETQIEKE